MENEPVADKKAIITEIRQKFRLLKAIAFFIVVTLFAVILRYLYKPAHEAMDFLPDISVSLILVIILILTVIGFYMWEVVSRRTIRSIEEYKNRLDRILHITKELREEIYADVLLDKIMDYSISITDSDAGSILLAGKDSLIFKIVRGEKAPELVGKAIQKGRGIIGWVAENGTPLRVPDARADERFNAEVDEITGYQTRSVLCVPLIMKGRVIGVIELLNKKEDFFSEKDEEIITYLADQAAISLSRAQFFEDQKNYEIYVTDMLLDSIDFHIPEKVGHSKRVANYSNIIARAINMPEEERKKLYFAALLHDVGFLKIKLDESFKPEEFKKHPVIGYEMIKPINFYADIAPFILHHHERYDGSGYPAGLSGEAIPLEARIIGIAEAFDAMVSETTYKVPLNFNTAIEELQRNAGSQFDFWLVDEFVSNISQEHLQ